MIDTVISQLTVSLAAQRIAKLVQATNALNELLKLADSTPSEARGTLHPSITGPISFNHVILSYPERKDVAVLKDIMLTINPGERSWAHLIQANLPSWPLPEH